MYNAELPVTPAHSECTQVETQAAMRAFRSGQGPILVTTRVTVRDINVRNIMHAINYNLPSMDHGAM